MSPLLSLLVLVGLLAGLMPGLLSAREDAPAEQIPPGDVVVRFYFDTRALLDAIAAEHDVWEVHFDAPADPGRESGYAVVQLRAAEYSYFLGQGYRLEIDQEKTDFLGINAPLDARYYYFDDQYNNSYNRYIVEFLQDTAAAYPELTELINIGTAWQGENGGYERDLWVLRISNKDPQFGPIEEKPAFYMIASIHAREVSTPELTIRYIKYLTSGYNGQGGYGVDADVTWLVDWNVTYLMPMANPDGFVVNTQNTSANRRKNMNNNECPTGNFGIDLNRNSSFFWNSGGSSGNPCYDTYRGLSAASEPEVDYFQEHFALVMKDQNGPNGDYEYPPAAPITTTGIFITLHSYTDLVLWPWGHIDQPAPNAAGLQRIGRKFAYYNNYTPQQSVDLYLASGTTDEWAYGKFGLPAYTFEVGPGGWGSCSGFFPAYGCIDGIDGRPRNFWAENGPAFLYAHKIARTPYMTSYGPDTQNVAVTPDPVPQGEPVLLTALIQDHRYGGDPLAPVGAAEYFIGHPGEDGTGFPMAPQDGSWGGTTEWAQATIDTSSLEPGTYYILVHGQKQSTPTNYWGPFTAVFLTVEPGGPCEAVAIQGVDPQANGCVVTFAADLLGDPPFTYNWDFGDWGGSNAANPTVDFQASGTYPYTLTVSNCGGADSDSYDDEVTVVCCEPPYGVDFSYAPPDPVVGETIFFTGTVAGGTAPLTFVWDMGDGTTFLDTPTVVYSYTQAGLYTVTLNVANVCGMAVAVHPLTVAAACEPVEIITATAAISGCVADFTVEVTGDPPFTYLWAFGDGMTSTEALPTHVYAASGEYHVTVEVWNCDGAGYDTMSFPVEVTCPGCVAPFDVVFDWAPDPPVAGAVTTLTGSAKGTAPLTYTWDLGDGSSLVIGPSAITHTYALGGDHVVVLTVTNACGHAVVSDVVTVAAPAIEVPPVPPRTLEPGASFQGALVISNTGDYTLTWTLAEVARLDWLDEDPTAGTVAPGLAFKVTLYYTAPVTPGLYTGALHIFSDDPLMPLVEVPVTLTVEAPDCEPVAIVTVTQVVEECTVSFSADLRGDPPFTYLWDLGDGATSTLANPTHTYTQTGVYSATLDVWNCGGSGHYSLGFAVTVECAAPPPPPVWRVYLPVVVK